MWDYLKKTNKPVILYGMGNAAQRIIDILSDRDIPVSGIFASDGFVRGNSFAGFEIKTYDQIKEEFGEVIVLLCFGSHRKEVIDNIKRIASEQELYAPDLPVTGDGLFTKAYEQQHRDDISWLHNILADDKSRDVLNNLLEYRKSGIIDYLFKAETEDEENLKLFDFSKSEVYMDLGAYTGDTVDEFVDTVGMYKKIYAVEPEERNFRKLRERTARLDNIELINAAIGDADTDVMFTHGIGRGGALGKGKMRIARQRCIDSILAGEDVSYIKFDVEGAEYNAISGGKQSIKEFKPKLLVAAYHRIDDYWLLPKLILNINPEYKIYMRKSYSVPCWEVNFYCI